MRYTFLSSVDYELVLPHQITLDECIKRGCWKETKVVFQLDVLKEHSIKERVETLERLDAWDKVDTNFWSKGHSISQYEVGKLIVTFYKANVKSRTGWNWLITNFNQSVTKRDFIIEENSV